MATKPNLTAVTTSSIPKVTPVVTSSTPVTTTPATTPVTYTVVAVKASNKVFEIAPEEEYAFKELLKVASAGMPNGMVLNLVRKLEKALK